MFQDNWKIITADPQVLNTVSGLKVIFSETPVQWRDPHWPRFSETEQSRLQEEVVKMMEKGAIKVAEPRKDQFLGHLFLRPKKDGTFRPVFNLKKLNAFVRYEHFKMEGMSMVADLLVKDDWMIKIDLKDAYYCVPIAETHRKFFRFRWKGELCESGSSVWSGISPQDVHKTPEAGYGPAEAHGAQGDYLSGRPVSLQPGEISPATGQRHSNLVVAVPGVCPQLGEIRTDADSDPGFSGVDGRFKKDVTLAPRKENGGDQGTLRSAVEQQGGDGERTSPASGEIDEHSEGSASSSAPLQAPSDGENKGAAKRGAELRDAGVDVGGGAGGAEMVDRVVELGEWQTTDCPKPRPGNDHRCIRQRLGSSVPRRNYSRCMGQAGDKQTHKPPRIEGSEVCHYGLCEGSKGFTHSCEVRQQHDSGPDKQDGGHEVDRVAGRDQEAVVFLSHERDHSYCRTSAGQPEFHCGPVLKSVPGLQQLETSDKGVPGVGDQMGPVRGGHVRRQAEQTEGDVLQLEARPTGSGDRCVHGALGQPEGVSVSAVLPNRQMSVKNKEGRGQGGADSTDVASTTMVSTTPVNARRLPKIVAAHEGSAGVTVGNPSSAHGNKQPLAGGLESVWQRSRQQGLSEGAATLVTKAWRRGTACAYNAPGTSGLAGVVRERLIHFKPLWGK